MFTAIGVAKRARKKIIRSHSYSADGSSPSVHYFTLFVLILWPASIPNSLSRPGTMWTRYRTQQCIFMTVYKWANLLFSSWRERHSPPTNNEFYLTATVNTDERRRWTSERGKQTLNGRLMNPDKLSGIHASGVSIEGIRLITLLKHQCHQTPIGRGTKWGEGNDTS